MIEWIIGGALAGAITSGSVMSNYLLSAYREKTAQEKIMQSSSDNPFENINENDSYSIKNSDINNMLDNIEPSVSPNSSKKDVITKKYTLIEDNKLSENRIYKPVAPVIRSFENPVVNSTKSSSDNKSMRDIDKVQAFINTSKSVRQNDFKIGVELIFYNFNNTKITVGVSSITPIWGNLISHSDNVNSDNFFGENGYYNFSILKMDEALEASEKYIPYPLRVIFKPAVETHILKGMKIEIYDLSNYDRKSFTIQ